MASAAGCTPLTKQILPSRLSISSYPEVDPALTQWVPDGDLTSPSSSNKAKQKAWDLPKVQASYEFLVNTSQGPVARARLLGAASREAGAWLNAPQSPPCMGLRMDDDAISICVLQMDDDAISICVRLRLGVPLCRTHLCRQCGATVDEYALHGLSCVKSQGRHPCHNAINDIIHLHVLGCSCS